MMNVTCQAAFEDKTEKFNKHSQIRRSALSLLGIAFSGFTIVSKLSYFVKICLFTNLNYAAILFYEISIVNFIFNGALEKLPKPLNKFSNKELASFGELAGTFAETSLIEATDPASTRFLNKSYPWNRCHTWDECYKKLLDPKDAMKYMVVFEPEGMYEIQNRRARSLVTLLDTKGLTPPLKGASGAPHGWYMSTSVAQTLSVKLNQELLKIKLNGALAGIMNTSSENSGCGEKKMAISPPILVITLSLLIGPNIVIILAILSRKAHLAKKIRDEKLKVHEPDYEDYNQIMAMAANDILFIARYLKNSSYQK